MSDEIKPQVVEGVEARKARLQREKDSKVQININRNNIPDYMRMITVVYDLEQKQMQVQGHLGDEEFALQMLDMAKAKVSEHHKELRDKQNNLNGV